MSTNTIHKTLQIAYPLAVFLAVITTQGMRLVQAGSTDLNHLFPNHPNDPFYRIIASNEVKACLNPDDLKHFKHPQTCSREGDSAWTFQSSGGQGQN